MSIELRPTGIDVVGDKPWGTHFCHFYETREDLLQTLVPYFKAGLENKEFCLWIISPPLTEEEARSALRQAFPEFDRCLAERSMEILPGDVWYLEGGVFDLQRALNGCQEKLQRALARGYAGMRLTGDGTGLKKKDWRDFCEYERELNDFAANRRIIALCTYPLAASGAAELLDVARTHQFAVAIRNGNWEMVETPELKQAKEEIKRLSEELEQRVVERTRELAATNEELRREISARKRAEDEVATRQGQLEEAQALAHLGSWNWDILTGSLTWSEELYRVFGVNLGEFCPTHEVFLEHLHPQDRPVFKAAIEGALSTRSPYDCELRIVRSDGSLRILHSRGRVIFGANGKPLRMIGTAQDITEGKRAHKELAKRAQQQVAVAELSQRALTADNLSSLLNEAVAAIAETLGVEICSALELLPGGDAFLVKAGVGWAPGLVGSLRIPAGASSPAGYTLLRNEPVVFGDLEHETRFEAPPELSSHGILSGAVVTILGRDRPFGALHALSRTRRVFTRDDLHFLQSVANIVATAIQRQVFEKEILEISEREQRRIGQDLHDDFCQHLAGIQLISDVLQRDLSAKAKPEAEQAGVIAERIRDAIAHARMLARGLSPVSLDANGLTAALQELAENSGKLFQIRCEFRFDSFVAVDNNAVATHLYRIAQEAVTNAVKHGRAKKVVIQLAESEDKCSLTITDDGVGLPETSAEDQGTGLRIMKYRAATIGASLEVCRAGEQGTRVSCSFHKQPGPKDW